MAPNRKGEIPPTRRSPEGDNHTSPDNSSAAGRQTPGGGRRSRRSHTTYRMAVSAIFCALGVVVLGLGALVEVIDTFPAESVMSGPALVRTCCTADSADDWP